MRATREERRAHYRELIPLVFDTTAELYYTHWGEFFHLAVFEDGEDETDFDSALERTHERYCDALGGAAAGRILEVATGGGAFAEWLARRTSGEVLGIDLSDAQLAHARGRVNGGLPNLRFLRHDIMRIAELDEPLFDAAVCLDAGCYLPDKAAALCGIDTRLRSGARFLLVDWCRPEQICGLQEEMNLEPFYRYWAIPEMESVSGYQRAFAHAGFDVTEIEDLSAQVAPNWERGYRIAQSALAMSLTPHVLVRIAAGALRHGPAAVRVLKDQFYAAVFAKAAANAGLLRYVCFLAERD